MAAVLLERHPPARLRGRALRIRLTPAGNNAVSVQAADTAGQPVASIRSLVLRPVSPDQVRAARTAHHEDLYRLEWPTLPQPAATADTDVWAVIGAEAPDWAAHGITRSATDLKALSREITEGAARPRPSSPTSPPHRKGRTGPTPYGMSPAEPSPSYRTGWPTARSPTPSWCSSPGAASRRAPTATRLT
ncbi:hypothetical protein QBA75_32045 [Streptomyces stelliscabiei]